MKKGQLKDFIEEGNVEKVKQYLEQFPDQKNAGQNRFNWTPAHLAVEYHQLALLQFLINEAGADFHSVDNAGSNLLHHALYFVASKPEWDIVKYLLDTKKFRFDATKDDNGNTTLHLAFKNCNLKQIGELSHYYKGSKEVFQLRNNHKQTPLSLLKERVKGSTESMKIVEKLQQDIEGDLEAAEKKLKNSSDGTATGPAAAPEEKWGGIQSQGKPHRFTGRPRGYVRARMKAKFSGMMTSESDGPKLKSSNPQAAPPPAVAPSAAKKGSGIAAKPAPAAGHGHKDEKAGEHHHPEKADEHHHDKDKAGEHHHPEKPDEHHHDKDKAGEHHHPEKAGEHHHHHHQDKAGEHRQHPAPAEGGAAVAAVVVPVKEEPAKTEEPAAPPASEYHDEGEKEKAAEHHHHQDSNHHHEHKQEGEKVASLVVVKKDEQEGEHEDPSDSKCENCDDDKPAVKYCIECDSTLCRDCLSSHDKLKATQGHSVIGIMGHCGSCDEPNKPAAYCQDCKCDICEDCVADHKRLKVTKDHAIITLAAKKELGIVDEEVVPLDQKLIPNFNSCS